MNEKVQTLADLLHADVSKITASTSKLFYYNKGTYWVVTESEKGTGPGTDWRWIGQLGNIHAYKKK